jgi:hypothetical protein
MIQKDDVVVERLRIGTSVGHGEKSGLGVLDLEVLVGKLFAIDGFTTSALCLVSIVCISCMMETYVAAGEITTLEHKLWDDTVEGRARVTEALLTGAESTEVLGGLWDYVIVEGEVDATRLLY